MNFVISPVHTVETKVKQGFTSQTHYRSYWGRVFTVETNTAWTINCQHLIHIHNLFPIHTKTVSQYAVLYTKYVSYKICRNVPW